MASTSSFDLPSLVGKTLHLRLLTSPTVQEGVCVAIEPAMGSLVFLQRNDTTGQVGCNIIMVHTIASIDVVEANPLLDKLGSIFGGMSLSTSSKQGSDTKTLKQKEAVKNILSRHHVPFRDAGDHLNVMDGSVFIDLPFQPHSCRSDNQVALGQIQSILSLDQSLSPQ
eukprot:GILK01009336.1.p1 GENE.GILK01009336.1~~GILK01009336.1.p1  ORF type:complete len:193 (-),score=21.42 GILK01009336.1:115-618(-)